MMMIDDVCICHTVVPPHSTRLAKCVCCTPCIVAKRFEALRTSSSIVSLATTAAVCPDSAPGALLSGPSRYAGSGPHGVNQSEKWHCYALFACPCCWHMDVSSAPTGACTFLWSACSFGRARLRCHIYSNAFTLNSHTMYIANECLWIVDQRQRHMQPMIQSILILSIQWEQHRWQSP